MKRILIAASVLLMATAVVLLAIRARDGAAQAGPAPLSLAQRAANAADTVVVYKTPTCGCCSDWADHVADHGFTVVTHDLNDLSLIRQQLGVPAGRISCHTAVVRGYTVEGHVPADLIQRMLAERPRFRGLTVPGMPVGSPGMEGPFKQDYDVLSFDDAGNVRVYDSR